MGAQPAGTAGTAGRLSAPTRSAAARWRPSKKLVMVHTWLKIETMKESGQCRETDVLEHTDEGLTWKQLASFG